MSVPASEATTKTGTSKRTDNRANVLGVGVAITSTAQALDKIDRICQSSLPTQPDQALPDN